MTTVPRSILFVDDEENVLSAVRRSLRKEGYQLHFTSQPAMGLELLRVHAVDIVVADHTMPNLTGIEFLKIVRNRYPNIMRMMMTGQSDLQIAIDAINHGEIFRFLAKPWDDAELKAALYLGFEQLTRQRENRRLMGLVGALRSTTGLEPPGIPEKEHAGAYVLDLNESSA